MGWISKFARLSPERRRLVVTSAGMLVVVRLGLRVFTYRRVHDLLERRARAGQPAEFVNADDAETTANVVWAVTSAAARLPGTTCLPRALVGRFLLQRAGCPARVRFGVAKQSDGAFAAHAWLESRDQVLLGGETMLEYSPMRAWPPDVA